MTDDMCDCGHTHARHDERGYCTAHGEHWHCACGQVPSRLDEDYRPAVEDMTEMGFHAG